MMRSSARFSFLHVFASALAVLAPVAASRAQTSAPEPIQAMQLVGGQSGWLLAGSRLFWTDSVGAKWAEVTPAQAGAPYLASAFFSPQGKGAALLTSPDGAVLTLAQTPDKGQHWTYSAIASPFTEAAVFNGSASTYFVDGQHGWIMLGVQSSSAFRRGILLTTTDGGLQWTQNQAPPVGGDLYFTDAAHGWTGPGPNGDELFSTSDAGQTWEAAVLPAASTALAHVHSTISLPVFTDAMNGSLLRTYAGDMGTSVDPTRRRTVAPPGGHRPHPRSARLLLWPSMAYRSRAAPRTSQPPFLTMLRLVP